MLAKKRVPIFKSGSFWSLPHPPLQKFVWKGLFHSLIYQAGLVRWLGCCTSTVVVTGSIPAYPVKVLWIIVKGSYQHSKVEGRRRDSWRRPSTFFLSPEEGPPLPKFVWKGLFHSLIYQAGLVRWLGRCSATAVVPGSIPNDPVKI